MADRVRDALGGSLAGKRVAVLGLTFKPNTDDMRDAPSLTIIPKLIEGGASVVAYDPVGMDHAKLLLPGTEFEDDAYAAAKGADALVLVTEWEELRGLNLKQIATTMRGRLLIDLRNVYEPEEAERAGLTYKGIGRG